MTTWSFSDVALIDKDLGCLDKAPMQQVAQDVAVQSANQRALQADGKCTYNMTVQLTGQVASDVVAPLTYARKVPPILEDPG